MSEQKFEVNNFEDKGIAKFDNGIMFSDGTQQNTASVQGIQGVQGIANQGVQGTTGLQGLQGIQGNLGTQGTQGTNGTQGTQGTQGNTGSQGVQGPTGQQGNTGSTGLQGSVGSTGSQGIQGVQGHLGNQGTQGIIGSTGAQGINGNNGTNGAQGTAGLQGIQGLQGTQGIQGIQGPVTYAYAINAQIGTSYTPVLSDQSSMITLNNASAISVTIPTNASVAYPIGTQLNFLQYGAGQVTISAVNSSTTLIVSQGSTSNSPKLRTTYSAATAIQIATDVWWIAGDIV